MHARMTRLEASPERLDDMASQFEQQTLPRIQALDGFEGYTLYRIAAVRRAVRVPQRR